MKAFWEVFSWVSSFVDILERFLETVLESKFLIKLLTKFELEAAAAAAVERCKFISSTPTKSIK